ncbi:inositol-3-phosphate synthase [Botrimarina mediterranea]|uniref:Inositol-3-phosphate synthase n=1 Tax=Botrimarina mediterranea TaxID=2528022 RepID=A0A518KDU8_9BACT|nr:inositol-3-phosphate synthase [Botrimarina mediterranea]QDV75973.1 Inositol-3-phosphate synthase [Botrimarina mediterranea]QDV80568.1 Inositol-3-phosphate synthase [Planctomycetes bacterium K2D]
MADGKTGVWLIGARGGVATTVAVGLAALRRGDAPAYGLVTETAALAGVDLPAWDQIVLGGHEVRGGTLVESARELEKGRVIPVGAAERYADELAAVDASIRPGVLVRSGRAIETFADAEHVAACATPREAVQKVATDLRAFRAAHDLKRVVMVLVASTEPPVDEASLPTEIEALDALLDDPLSDSPLGDDAARCPLRASSLYALGAVEAGAALVNFTPSRGANCQAIEKIFFRAGLPHCGADGKTGETLLKSTLAPMFAARHLHVDSWVGHNLLGNRDGAVLADLDHKKAKVQSKEQLLASLLGEAPQSHVSIESIDSLGDWKTAWDHVHFRGFLGVPMTLQFTWQGCDSALAAPLVIDLVRLMDLALRRQEKGAIGALAAFFKSPLGAAPRGFVEETQTLIEWATR